MEELFGLGVDVFQAANIWGKIALIILLLAIAAWAGL